ncbi:hypothetical protein ACFQ4N_01860 [Oceanobacillus iheyensis]|uniref:hypothetical protein n=1 Tax=Oceanobacillus iheyensis TaxID=182710 RepID=UPI00363FE371
MRNRFITTGLTAGIIGFTILHFFTYFQELESLILLMAISGFAIVLFATFYYGPSNLKMPLGLFVTGIVIFLFTDADLIDGLREGLQQMRNMIGLLVVIPMVSWVLREEAFLESIISFGHRMLNSSRKFYLGMVSFTQIIAYFLLFGAIPMMYQFVSMILKDEKGEAWEYFKGTALLRGFALSVMWVLSIPSFAYVVEIMGASLSSAIIQGMAVAIFGSLLALVFTTKEQKRYQVNFTAGLQKEIDEVLHHSKNKKEMNRVVREFAILFITLFGSIFILSFFVEIELLVLIPLAIVVWIICYYVMKRRVYKLTQIATSYIKEEMASKSYQLCVMLGAGMLITSLSYTSFAENVVNGIYSIQNVLPFVNVLYLLPIMVIILGFFGLGPLTVMVLVAGILQSIHLPYPPELIVLAVTLGSSISIMLSPVIMPIIILSGSNGLSGFKNGLRFNGWFALAFYIVVMAYIQIMVVLTS